METKLTLEQAIKAEADEAKLLGMALAEAGYPVEVVPSGRGTGDHMLALGDGNVTPPSEVLWKAFKTILSACVQKDLSCLKCWLAGSVEYGLGCEAIGEGIEDCGRER